MESRVNIISRVHVEEGLLQPGATSCVPSVYRARVCMPFLQGNGMLKCLGQSGAVLLRSRSSMPLSNQFANLPQKVTRDEYQPSLSPVLRYFGRKVPSHASHDIVCLRRK